MVNAQRLLQRLSPFGFEPLPERSGDLRFSRKACLAELFEQIHVGCAGKKGEVAWASIAISTVKGPCAFEGLMEERYLLEIASDAARGWFEFRKRQDVVSSENRLVSVGPRRAAEFASVAGENLLSGTKAVRSLSSKYADHVRAHTAEKNPDYLEYQLSRLATAEQRREASRLADLSDFGDSSYQAAALALLLYCDEIEGTRDKYRGKSPSNDIEFLRLITVLADRLCFWHQPIFNAAWRTSNAVTLAQSIYADRAFDRMPILAADALEDACCDNADILNHCRKPGEHVRGCWVVDLVLAKD
jgi:hypothetical protein